MTAIDTEMCKNGGTDDRHTEMVRKNGGIYWKPMTDSGTDRHDVDTDICKNGGMMTDL